MIFLLGFDAEKDGPRLYRIVDCLKEHFGEEYAYTIVDPSRFEAWLEKEIHSQALEFKKG